MQESTKTKAFVGGAAVMVIAAAISHFLSQPRSASDFENVGKPFFENFDSSSQATSLEVVAVDPETVQRSRFKVAKVDGLWRIPSHENYPAEASDRLATTASSIIGIERESLAGRGKTDFDRLGVVDPLSDEIEDPETVGQRITLKDEDDETLADYIIGKQVDDVSVSAVDRPFESGSNRQTYFYVRHAEEQQTYVVPLKLDLSTKFSDWIDPDLLRFDASNLNQVTVRNYLLKEQASGNPLMRQRALVKKEGDILALTKSDSNAWELAGVEPATEEFDGAGVTEMIEVLGELQIEDVRKKLTFQGKQLLTPDLKVNEDPELMKSRDQFSRAISQLVAELEDKGFNLAGTQAQLELVSNHGEIEFGTNEGMRYTLYVGAPFEEGEAEIKVSGAVDSTNDEPEDESDASKADGKESDQTEGDTEDAAEPDGDNQDDDDADAKSRYMLVRVVFDPSLLKDKPEEPAKPEEPKKPEGYTPPPAPEDDADAAVADEQDKSDSSDADEKESEEATAEDADDAEETPARSPEFEAFDVAMEQYEQAENLKALQLSRSDLVTKKKPPVAPPGAAPKKLPNRPNISFEGGPESTEPLQPKDEPAAPAENDTPATEASEPAEASAAEPTVVEPEGDATGSADAPAVVDQETATDPVPVTKPPTTPPVPAAPVEPATPAPTE